MIPQWEQDIINSKQKKYIYSIEWLDKNEQVLDEVILDVVSGNMNFDGTKSNRRSASITLKNLDKKYTPKASGVLWINNKVKIKCGYAYGDNQKLLYNKGTFVIGDPSILSSPSQKEITLELHDKWVLLDGTISGKLQNKTIIPVGTRIDTAIKNLVTDLGKETKYIIDDCDYILPYTIEKQPNETIASIIEEICFIVSYESFYDDNGFFRFRKALMPKDYDATPISWRYTSAGLYLQNIRDLKWTDVRNSIRVIGDTLSDGTTISAVVKDESDSDLSIGKIGERTETIEDNNIYTNALALERANYELKQKIMIAESLRTIIIPNFSHTVGDIIEIVDENNGTEGRYLIQTIDFGMSYDSVMNLGLWAIRDWR